MAISSCIAVVHKQVITLVGRHDRPRMFDRTPILLRTGRHFANVADQPIGIAAEGAVGFFNAVQIRKQVPIDDEVRSARHTRYPCLLYTSDAADERSSVD